MTEDAKPLGFGESVNNIGVETITLESTRTQYNFTNTSFSEEFTHNNSQWQKPGGLTDDQTSVVYNPKDITIHVSPLTGEFVAWVYPEPYNISEISVSAGDGAPRTVVYDNNEMINLTSSPVPSDDMLKTVVRQWADSVHITGVPGVVDHWQQVERSDTVRFHAEWSYFYQAIPTFSVTQMVNNQPSAYFGEATFTVTDPETGDEDELQLYDPETGEYLFGAP